MPSPIDQLILDYRNAISAKDMATLEDLTRAWLRVERGLEADIASLAAEIERRVALGETVTDQMLWKMQSYHRTMANMETLIASYNQTAIEIIGKAQSDAYLLGVTKANDLIVAEMYSAGLTPPYWERMNKDAIEAALGVMNDKNPFYASLYKDYGDATGAFRQALIDGIARGQGVGKLAEMMRDATGMGLDRSLLIAQTEMSRAYRSGTIAAIQRVGSSDLLCAIGQEGNSVPSLPCPGRAEVCAWKRTCKITRGVIAMLLPKSQVLDCLGGSMARAGLETRARSDKGILWVIPVMICGRMACLWINLYT